MNINNKKFIKNFADTILNRMELSEIKRYVENFPYEVDFNIYQYGCLDCYEWDLVKTLKQCGLTSKVINTFETGCVKYSDRDKLRDIYKWAVREAVNYLLNKKGY